MLILLAIACSGPDLPSVVIEADRSGHLFNRPFPSDELLDSDGTVNLTDFPDAGTELGTSFVQGWSRQAGDTVMGWSALAPVAVRFDAPVEVPAQTAGNDEDVVRLVSVQSGHQPALQTRFVADPDTDPFLARNLLLLQPVPWDALRSGETYELWIDPDFANSEAQPVSSFTVQDSLGQLAALRVATDAMLDADPSMLQAVDLKRVTGIEYDTAGTSPSGKDATEFTVTFEDGSTEISYSFTRDGLDPAVIDLSDDSMEVWQATIQTVAFQDLSGQPYGSPGISFLSDFDKSDGWIAYDADGGLASTQTAEAMRIVMQIPKAGTPNAVMTWDHGTGGHAYNAVNRVGGEDFTRYRAAFTDAGVAIVSRDQPLYGTRFPLIDEGFGASIGFYNIGNLPAWRDNQRQGGVDHRVLHRFSTEVLPGLFPGRVSADRVGAFGHSLGSVTAHIGLAIQQGDGAEHALMSGAGGNFTYYATDTGLLGSDNDVVGLLGPLLGVELPDNPTGSQAVGALLGVPEAGWDEVDGLHPALGLFQLIMDPSDALALAPHQVTRETVVMGVGDFQVPNFTTEWMVQGTADSTLIECQPLGDYDPHQCFFREDEGFDAVEQYLDDLTGP